MSGVRRVNVNSCELDEHFERGTIANRATALRPKLGGVRIGAGLYEVDAGRWVWPYHYHHGVEEWLYVVGGAPVLRDMRGERTLSPGDFVCFPSGYEGAHTVGGPGRFVIFSMGGWEASVSVYPDSDKVGPRPGNSSVPGLDDLEFRRRDAVDYWYGEGSDEPVPVPDPVMPPAEGRPLPVYNALTVEAETSEQEQPDGFQRRVRRLGKLLGAERLVATLCELDPGQGGAPYHCEYGREEWLLVLTGSPLLRHPDGEDRLSPGDLVCLPDGPAGARRLTNPANDVARAIFFSTGDIPSVRQYLDVHKMMVRYSHDRDAVVFPRSAAEGAVYWEGGLV
jgi:uncharacterized cupin superfamily protein